MKHRDFVILVRGDEEINALVASSHVVTTPATQTEPAFDTEHLTLVFLEPAAGVNIQQTGEALRNSIKTQIDVPPVDKGMHFGWREVGPTGPPPTDPMQKSSGIDGDAGDWTRTAGEGLTDDTSAAPLAPEPNPPADTPAV